MGVLDREDRDKYNDIGLKEGEGIEMSTTVLPFSFALNTYLCVYSNHRISSNISIRALQSVPKLTTPFVTSGAWKMPSPRLASVNGQIFTPPPALTKSNNWSGLECVQCTATNRDNWSILKES